jgi:hypothetical protein
MRGNLFNQMDTHLDQQLIRIFSLRIPEIDDATARAGADKIDRVYCISVDWRELKVTWKINFAIAALDLKRLLSGPWPVFRDGGKRFQTLCPESQGRLAAWLPGSNIFGALEPSDFDCGQTWSPAELYEIRSSLRSKICQRSAWPKKAAKSRQIQRELKELQLYELKSKLTTH